MKYIRTLQNLKKIMDNAPELVEYKKYSEAYEEYIYKDESISFSIFCYEDDIKNMTVNINCEGISVDLYYVMIGDEWVYDTSVSSKQKDVTALNRELKDILSQIKEGEYTPVDDEDIQLTLLNTQFPECEEKSKFEELRTKALNDFNNVEFTNELNRGILAVAYGIDDNNYFILQLDKDDESQTYTLQGKYKGNFILSNFEIIDNQAIDFRDIPLTEDEKKEVDEMLDKLGIAELSKNSEETKKAEQLSMEDSAQPEYTKQDNYTKTSNNEEGKMKDVLLGTLDAVIKTYKDNLTIVNDEECIYKDNNLSIGISKGAQVLEIIVDYPDGEWAVYTYMRDDSNDEWEESSIERSSDKHNLMQDLIDIVSLDIEKYTEAIK